MCPPTFIRLRGDYPPPPPLPPMRPSPDKPSDAGRPHYHGPLEDHVWACLHAIWEEPWAVSSNAAREFSAAIGLLASMGWISTVSPDGTTYSRLWRITGRGVKALKEKA